jgi:hypothetical protein
MSNPLPEHAGALYWNESDELTSIDGLQQTLLHMAETASALSIVCQTLLERDIDPDDRGLVHLIDAGAKLVYEDACSILPDMTSTQDRRAENMKD